MHKRLFVLYICNTKGGKWTLGRVCFNTLDRRIIILSLLMKTSDNLITCNVWLLCAVTSKNNMLNLHDNDNKAQVFIFCRHTNTMLTSHVIVYLGSAGFV